MVTTAFFAPLVGAWKGAVAVKTALVTFSAAAGHMLPHGEVDHEHHNYDDNADHADHSHADPADHGDHGHEDHHEEHEEHEHDDHEHEEHEHEEEGDEMEETVEAAEFAHENGAASGGPPQFWRSFQKRSPESAHTKPTPDASATNAEAVLKAVAAAAAVASVTSRMVESRCQELGCRANGRTGASGRGMERRKPWRSCGDPFPNPSSQLSMVT